MVMDHFSMQGSVEHHLCVVCVHVHKGRERRRKEAEKEDRQRRRGAREVEKGERVQKKSSMCS